MDQYEFGSMLYEGPSFKTFQAWSRKYEKEVLVKVYQCSSITSSEILLKEAIRQAREKPRESATLVDVVLSSDDSIETLEPFYFNFVLEKKQMTVRDELIKRNDEEVARRRIARERGKYAAGLADYKMRQGLADPQPGDDPTKKVVLATSTGSGKEVVIKRRECFQVTQANELLREAFVLAFVEHEYNCRLLDVCFSKEAEYVSFHINLVLEKFDRDVNKDILERRRRGNRYPEAELIKLLQEVTRGLVHAKRLVSATQYIAHRDIKPQNIFISREGLYKLGDFGSAWKKARGTQVRTGAGTDFYMSPEMRQCLAEPQTYSVDAFLADVFSLGVTVLHMAALRDPLVTDPIRSEDVNSISDDLLLQIVRADPVLKAYRGADGIRQKLQEMLAKDIFLGVRLNIIRSAQETLRRISYSEDFKHLLYEMLEVDYNRRIRLESVIEKIEDLIARPAVDSNAPSVGPRQENTQAPPFLLGIGDGGVLRLFDLQSETWESPLVQRQLQIDGFTSYTFISDTAAVLCGSNPHVDSEQSVEVYRLELIGLRAAELPRFPGRRVGAGLLHYEGILFAFGGDHHTGNRSRRR